MKTVTMFRKTTIAVALGALALGAGALGYRLHQEPAALAAFAPVSVAQASPVQAAANVALPDFAELVAQHGAAVVNITVEQPARKVVLERGANPFEGTPFGEFFGNLPRQPDMGPQRGLGSGFLISEDGYLMTNAHVVGDARTVRVKLTDRREFDGRVIGRDRATDVALVKIDARGLSFVKLAHPNDVRVGEWVVAIGSPYGFENTVTAGIVSAKGRTLPDDSYVPFIQTDVAVNPGNSGGPLFNLKGEVVGINSQIYSRSGGYQGLSFAIPVDVARKVSDQLRASGKVTRGWMGVTIQEVSQDLANSFKLDKPRGALVSAVSAGGPAKAAGLRAGDIIVAFDGKPIGSSADLPQEVAARLPGSTAKLQVIREGKPVSIAVKVASLPEPGGNDAQAEAEMKGARLGVVVAELNAQQKQELGIDHGVQVAQVAPGAAERAGVRPGDVILQLGDKRIDSAATLRAAAAKLPDGTPAAMLVRREDGTIFLAVTPQSGRAG